ncbi:hypothetical protein [Aestuariirhabdus litorea]|uniref:Uncharacterized protein n=1 Tax=Aestuariirhabdus litorea TaxID=2528527 RepID=A0A3P3VRB1_9GAMM|nr:hypothetical protein [Aestuariirhabdus litorea]RRJ84847.1 hypothetical protein D0544_07090 [Aestuariirhabdus litorea]RWW98074.1 hypothetical protein DZC74_07085 [Endozoicomonadaceae bacterium GTF-13]
MKTQALSILIATFLMASAAVKAETLGNSLHPMLNLSNLESAPAANDLSDVAPNSIRLNPNTGLSLEYTSIDSDYEIQDELLGTIMQLRIKLVSTF